MKLSLRDLFWTVLVAGLCTAWWLQQRELRSELTEANAATADMDKAIQRLEARRLQLLQTQAALRMLNPPDSATFDLLLRAQAESVVVAVASDTNLVEIALGSDDRLAEGDCVEILRGDRYLGTAKVRKVAATRSVVELNRHHAPVRKGDEVRRSGTRVEPPGI